MNGTWAWQALHATPAREVDGVPVSVLVISLLCLAVAGAGNLLWSGSVPAVMPLVWLLLLAPPFLFAYYRGWKGAAVALAIGMMLLVGVEVGGSVLDGRAFRWWTVGAAVLPLIIVSFGVGALTDRLRRRERLALEWAYEDALTGLPNRRILELVLSRSFADARRGHGRFSVVLFDLDGFKQVNDALGHAEGDAILRRIGTMLRHTTRASDLIGRLGGDEFLAILPNEGADGALALARRAVEKLRDAEGLGGVVMSAGVAAYDPSMTSGTDLLEAADRALYAAKGRHGARICIAVGKDELRPLEESPVPVACG
jgi:diguanylate cyclase (GGDEF)-like protein